MTATLAMHMLVPALPYAAHDMGVGSEQIQIALTVYILGLALGQLVYGPLADALGRRPVAIAGVFLFVVGSLICAVAQSLTILLIGRALQALGGASGLTLARAIARDIAGPQGSQRDISALNLIMLIGPAISPILGGLLAIHASWRAIFLVLGLAALGVLLAVLLRLPETAPERKPMRPRQIGRDFVQLGRSPGFVCIAAGGAMGSTAVYGYFAAAPFILQDQLGVPAAHVGWYLGGILLGALAGTWTSRLRVRWIGRDRFLMSSGLLALAVAAGFLTAALSDALTPGLLFALTFVMMFAAGCISPTALSASLDRVPALAGSAAGVFGAAQMAAGALSTWLVGLGTRHDVDCALTLTAAALFSLVLLWFGRERAGATS